MGAYVRVLLRACVRVRARECSCVNVYDRGTPAHGGGGAFSLPSLLLPVDDVTMLPPFSSENKSDRDAHRETENACVGLSGRDTEQERARQYTLTRVGELTLGKTHSFGGANNADAVTFAPNHGVRYRALPNKSL